MNGSIEDIARIVQDNFPDDTYFLVDLKIMGNPGNEKIIILVDGDHGVDMGTVSSISRAVSGELDRMDMFKDSYSLEVSSPGLDFPLQSLRQYRKNIGKLLMIVLQNNETLRGELLDADDQGIRIRLEQGSKKKQPPVETHIVYQDIKKTKVLVTFK